MVVEQGGVVVVVGNCLEKVEVVCQQLVVVVGEGKVVVFVVDFLNLESVQMLFVKLVVEYSDIDFFVNMVGIFYLKVFLEYLIEDYNNFFDLNCLLFFIIQQVVVLLVVQKKLGLIVNVIVVVVCQVIEMVKVFVYLMVKMGLDVMIRYVVVELVEYGICVNVVSFGMVEIKIFEWFIFGEQFVGVLDGFKNFYLFG